MKENEIREHQMPSIPLEYPRQCIEKSDALRLDGLRHHARRLSPGIPPVDKCRDGTASHLRDRAGELADRGLTAGVAADYNQVDQGAAMMAITDETVRVRSLPIAF